VCLHPDLQGAKLIQDQFGAVFTGVFGCFLDGRKQVLQDEINHYECKTA